MKLPISGGLKLAGLLGFALRPYWQKSVSYTHLGYKPEFAGAVEAAASTGGQIMPPIMGAAAFLMAEYMNVTYAEVATRAILPAILYFTGIFIAVHLEAKKLGLRGMSKDQLPKVSKLIRKVYLLLPLVCLLYTSRCV